MVNTLLVYKGEEVIKRQQENKEGKTSVVIDGLKSNTDYTKGTYKLAWSNGAEEGPKADVPAFKTKKIGVTTVTAKPSSTNIVAGKTQQITSEVTPTNADDKTLTYTSNNEPVATVNDSGLINAVKAGNATITVKSNDNAKAIAKVSVTVEKAVVNVSSVELTPATATLDVGATQQLSSNVLPSDADNKKVTYSTGSDAIATVSATGLVTAVGEGTTDITVTTEDGAKTAVCTLTVTAKQIPVTGVTLDKSTLSLEVGATETLNATVAPSNASYKAVGFTSSDEGIATVDNDGLVTAVAAGSTDITVESIADGSKTAVCTLTVTEPPEEVTDPPAE